MTRGSTLARLATVAEDQWGLVTRRQAELAGVPRATLDRITSAEELLERIGHGVYHLAGAPLPDHLELRAAWLRLAPETPAWERRPEQGVVSHRSAAALYGLGDLPADIHQFTLPVRRQSRRPDVRLHRRLLTDGECTVRNGLPVTRPARIASDLLDDREDPGAVAQVVADAIREGYEQPAEFTDALRPHSARFGLRRHDGLGLLRWLLDLTADPRAGLWIDQARSRTAADRPPTA